MRLAASILAVLLLAGCISSRPTQPVAIHPNGDVTFTVTVTVPLTNLLHWGQSLTK